MKKIMKRAWEIVKNAIANFGGKCREYMAEALRMAWAESKPNKEDKTMKHTYEWQLRDGRTVTLEAEYSEHVQDKIIDSDGYKLETGEREIVKDGMLTAYIDGAKVDSCWNTDFWQTIDVGQTGLRKIWGIGKIGFTADRSKEIDAFFAAVFAAGRDAEAEQIRAEEKAKLDAERIETTERFIAKAEAQSDIPTRAEAKRKMKEYNDIYNEGGEGYIPYVICREDYEAAKKRLAELKGN